MMAAFDLFDYADVAEHADAIVGSLRSGQMPCYGAWPASEVDKLQQWIDAQARLSDMETELWLTVNGVERSVTWVAGAIGNAAADAVGVRVRDLPLTRRLVIQVPRSFRSRQESRPAPRSRASWYPASAFTSSP